jgi:hypothetical protein
MMQYMNTQDIRAKLEKLSSSQMQRLADLSELHVRTLWGIRCGTTKHASETTRDKLTMALRKMPRSAFKERE